MKATLIANEAPGGKRTRLEDALPLATPYVLQIFPIYACNFTCKYCHFAVPREKRCFVTDRAVMDMDLYRKCIEEIALFPDTVRTLRFVGMGEPLLHREIDAMIAYAKERNVADRVELLTNASLLTSAMSDRLIAAGLDRLVISLQGTSAEAYKTTSNVDLDFDAFVDQIRYVYERKRNTHMYLKVVDIALDDEEDKQRYFAIFGDICDTIGIENAVPIFTDVPYNARLADRSDRTQFGDKAVPAAICPQPFYTMQVNPDGKVVGCHSIAYPEILGDCSRECVVDVWNGEGYNNFRRRMLLGMSTVCDVCRECTMGKFRMHEADVIKNTGGRLASFYA